MPAQKGTSNGGGSHEELIFVDDDLPGISRQRKGKGWCYFAANGKRITKRAEIDRLNAIALPPAYKDAWFCPAPNGHILATGYDAKGRKQYRYHPDFRAQMEAEKYASCAGFGKRLPLLRARVADDLQGRRLDFRAIVAAIVRLLDLSALRVGNECYARENGSFGATTLRKRHAKLTGRHLTLRYKAKSGKMRDVNITDRILKALIKRLQDMRGQQLFRYLDDDGKPRPVGSADVNTYIKEAMGGDFSAKHFRTWSATLLAFEMLASAKEDVPLNALLDHVSSHLGNTPTIARKSYIHPALIDLAKGDQAGWRASLQLPRKTKFMTREERGLVAMLEG